MNGDIVLSASEMFQLAAVGPCFFVALYLFSAWRNIGQTFLPGLYFIALGGLFVLQIADAIPDWKNSSTIASTLLVLQNLLPELSFLLILQFMFGARPKWIYWLVLAVPLIGGSPFVYLVITQNEVCLSGDICENPVFFLQLYRIFGAALVFMLLVTIMGRGNFQTPSRAVDARAKYCLIVTLILFNLIWVLMDLLELAHKTKPEEAEFIRTMIGVAFVYLVLSSIFRVFAESFGFRPMHIKLRRELTLKDKDMIRRMQQMMEQEKPYTKQGFNRKKMAEKLGVTEHQLSKAINESYKKSFSEVMNEYRLGQAKKLLKETSHPVTVISYDTGFASIASFNRVFKEATGLSPTAFRKTKESKSR
ncbi:MAG: AraC family transcriptional regulator [Proteobacteria bacterium]|nr:AraC family transcriptional regulator [Pseudomonadota bacterium]